MTHSNLAKHMVLKKLFVRRAVALCATNDIPAEMMILSPPAASFSSTLTWPSAISRTSAQQEPSFESASLDLEPSTITVS